MSDLWPERGSAFRELGCDSIVIQPCTASRRWVPLVLPVLLVVLWISTAVAWNGDNVTPAQADREAARGQQMQLTEPPAAPVTVPARPVGYPGDCDSWRAVFAWYGATSREVEFFFGNARPWGVSRTNIIWGETGCGLRFRNPDTSDTGICQLNGVHRGWVRDLFGLTIPTTEAAASNPDYLTSEDHPCYGTTLRTVVRVSSNGVTLEVPGSNEAPHTTAWPKAAHLTVADDGTVDWRGHPAQPDEPFLTLRLVVQGP
jgi:hypothetical protein